MSEVHGRLVFTGRSTSIFHLKDMNLNVNYAVYFSNNCMYQHIQSNAIKPSISQDSLLYCAFIVDYRNGPVALQVAPFWPETDSMTVLVECAETGARCCQPFSLRGAVPPTASAKPPPGQACQSTVLKMTNGVFIITRYPRLCTHIFMFAADDTCHRCLIESLRTGL